MNEAQAQQKQIIEELRQQEGIAQAQQLDYQSAHNDATKWREEFNSARCYLELEKKVEGLEAAARAKEIESLHLRNEATPIQKLIHSLEPKLAVAVRDMEIESLRLRNEELDLQLTSERILRYAAESGRNAETERCAKIAREHPLSPVVGKAIAALIMEGRK